MSYKLTYTGQQVQGYLTKVATGQVGGTDDYNALENKPVINADLDNTAANTAEQTVLRFVILRDSWHLLYKVLVLWVLWHLIMQYKQQCEEDSVEY